MIPPIPRPRSARPNPFMDTLKPYLPQLGNMISDAGYGLATGGFDNMFGIAAERAREMQPYRDQETLLRKQEQDRTAQTNATISWLQKQAAANPNNIQLQQIVQGLDMGVLDPASAFNAALQAQATPELTADQRNYEYAQQNPGFAEFLNPPKAASDTKPTATIQEYQMAVEQGFEGSLLDFQREMKQMGRAPMSAAIQKEVFEADEAVQSGAAVIAALQRALELNATAWDGPFAEQRGYGGALFGNSEGADTLELKNLVTSQALDQLRATFGAMPTEGERKILLEIQGSVDQPREVRARIFERALAAAQRRVEINLQKAEALRSGQYFDEGYGQQQAPGGTTSTGVPWSIE